MTGDSALDTGGGLIGDTLVGDATDNVDRLRDNEEEVRSRCGG